MAREAGAVSVHLAADDAHGSRRDHAVAAALGEVPLVPCGSPYAVRPGRVLNQQGRGYQVFTPYHRAVSTMAGGRRPSARPTSNWVDLPSDPLPAYDEITGAGERAARGRWTRYLDDLASYDEVRDGPDRDATSRMSIPLKYGRLAASAHAARGLARPAVLAAGAYRRECAWREFLRGAAGPPPRCLRLEEHAAAGVRADRVRPARPGVRWLVLRGGPAIRWWTPGHAATRRRGLVHNRVRMIVASFLVKDLHIHWKHGARWLHDPGRRRRPGASNCA